MQKSRINLWKDKIPGTCTDGFVPYMTYYPAQHKKGSGAVLIFPGGGYCVRCSDYEGEDYARFLNGIGVDAFVVEYRVAPDFFPAPLLDARQAVRTVRAHASDFGIDPQKIAVMGSSAGGHLAALVSTYRAPLAQEKEGGLGTVCPIPNATILCYAVIDTETEGIGHIISGDNLLGTHPVCSRAQVSPHLLAGARTPPAFLFHTAADQLVNVQNAYLYATRLASLGIDTEMHIYPGGRHGMGLAREDAHIAQWSGALAKWLEMLGYTQGEDENGTGATL